MMRNVEEKLKHTCKWTGMNLKVIKSHMGQYMTPFNNVGSKSRFKRATISLPFSPDNKEKLLSSRKLKIVKGGTKVLWNFVILYSNLF